MKVPFFRPSIGEAEIAGVVATLRSGWLTTGPRTKEFEAEFARYVGTRHAVAVTSCTAALHLALEAIGLRRGDLVIVPTLTFAATAEVVRYFDAVPVLVDSDPDTLCMDAAAVRRTLDAIDAGRAVAGLHPPYGRARAVIPVHYGGQMADMAALRALAEERKIALIEDAAHTLPAHFRTNADAPWLSAGSAGTVGCFSFYANKCITTGEGGMAVTNDDALADRMRIMSLHGLSRDAWKRFESGGSWYYEIVAPGFKYNFTDIAAALGIEQLRRADDLCAERRRLAGLYTKALSEIEGIAVPRELPNRKHAWHLYAIQIDPTVWHLSRDQFIEQLVARGVSCSVHWTPLHLHPYYRETYGYTAGLFPVAEQAGKSLVSLPIFPGMTEQELCYVVDSIRALTERHPR